MTYYCLNSIPDPDEEFWVNSKTFEYNIKCLCKYVNIL